MYDIVIVGGGPAGLTAAVYALRGGRRVVVMGKNGFGGQIAYSPKVENIPVLFRSAVRNLPTSWWSRL